jgi:hypothetical protein
MKPKTLTKAITKYDIVMNPIKFLFTPPDTSMRFSGHLDLCIKWKL